MVKSAACSVDFKNPSHATNKKTNAEENNMTCSRPYLLITKPRLIQFCVRYFFEPKLICLFD